jgi:hypothetical protein
MIRAVLWALASVLGLIFITLILAGPFYDMFSAFDDSVTDVNLPNLTSNWNSLSSILTLGFWSGSILTILAIVVWLYMKAQQREYVSGGYREERRY